MTRLVQIQNGATRRVALVEEPNLRILEGVTSGYGLAHEVAAGGSCLLALVEQRAAGERLSYEPIYAGRSEWRLLTPIDHPSEAARCLVSGTGLTHLGSAKNRQAMHAATEESPTDSMRIFREGLERGRP